MTFRLSFEEVKYLKTVLLIIQVLAALLLIAVILLQSGRTVGLSGSIAGAGEAFVGKKKGLNEFLSKITAYIAAVFIIITLILTLI